MCGIIGYIGPNKSTKVISDGLSKIEYRGYDSAGISWFDKTTGFKTIKVKGGVAKLEAKIGKSQPIVGAAIGHTRWATHGEPSEQNAHPHNSSSFSIVHNGIIENFEDIRRVLKDEGISEFASQTDTEVLAWLIERNYQRTDNVRRAIANSLKAVRGTFGLAILFKETPDILYLARRGSPLAIGEKGDGRYASSDITALPADVDRVTFMEDDQLAVLSRGKTKIYDFDHNPQIPVTEQLDIADLEATKKGYEHFMLKEIIEQPQTVAETIRGRLDKKTNTAVVGGLDLSPQKAKQLTNLLGVGCGTAYNAGLLASYMLEDVTDLPMQVEMASELLYRKRSIDAKSTLAIAISQSGETADTISAINKLNMLEVRTHGVVNAVGSSLSRITDGGTYLHCGPEIAVASTKAFTSQVVTQLLLGLKLNKLRGEPIKNNRQVIDALSALPLDMQNTVTKTKDQIAEKAHDVSKYKHLMFLGRNSLYPIAEEGALKFKEITYTQSEAHPAGEMKHGPLALVDSDMLVVYLLQKGKLFDKSLSNLSEIEARHGSLLVITDNAEFASDRDDTILIPESNPFNAPLLFNIPLQLLAYYVALDRGLNIDKPRNLAKSVTVE